MEIVFLSFLQYNDIGEEKYYRRGTMSICWNFPSNNNGKISGISEAGIETFRGDLL